MNKDFATGVSSFIIGLIFLYLCKDLPLIMEKHYPGPSFFPLLLTVILMISGAILMYSGLKEFKRLKVATPSLKRIIELIKSDEVRNAVLFIVITIIYIIAIPYLGFTITSMLYIAFVQIIYGVSILRAFPVAIASVLFIYILFIVVLRVVLPEPILRRFA